MIAEGVKELGGKTPQGGRRSGARRHLPENMASALKTAREVCKHEKSPAWQVWILYIRGENHRSEIVSLIWSRLATLSGA